MAVTKAHRGVEAISPNHMPPKLNWSVLWLKDNKTVVEVWCEDDLIEARRIYDKAQRAGKKMVTMRCANYPFPPPKKYTEKEITVTREVIRRGRKKKVKVRKTVNLMGQINRQKGLWWCPFCCEFRKFRHQLGFRMRETGIYVPQEGMYCPMCAISHKHGAVQKYNPEALKFEFRFRKRRKRGRRRRS